MGGRYAAECAPQAARDGVDLSGLHVGRRIGDEIEPQGARVDRKALVCASAIAMPGREPFILFEPALEHVAQGYAIGRIVTVKIECAPPDGFEQARLVPILWDAAPMRTRRLSVTHAMPHSDRLHVEPYAR
jgi:hypothetical protein